MTDEATDGGARQTNHCPTCRRDYPRANAVMVGAVVVCQECAAWSGNPGGNWNFGPDEEQVGVGLLMLPTIMEDQQDDLVTDGGARDVDHVDDVVQRLRDRAGRAIVKKHDARTERQEALQEGRRAAYEFAADMVESTLMEGSG